MPYLIDSDWAIDFLSDVPEARHLLDRLAEEGIAISIITYMEAYQGALRVSNIQQAHAKFQAFVSAVPILPLSRTVAEGCARLREELRRRGKRSGSRALDLIIAATALEYDLTLVTRNVVDYEDIPDLRLYR